MSNKSLSIGYSSPLFEDTNQTVYNQVLLLSKSFMIDKGNNSIFVKLFKQTNWTGFAEVLCTSALVEATKFWSPWNDCGVVYS